MKKGLVVILLFLIIVVSGYFIYKEYYLYKYQVNDRNFDNYEEYYKRLDILETIEVKSNTLNQSDYLKLGNIKIKNTFSEFENNSDDKVYRFSLKEDDKIIASLWAGVNDYNIILSMKEYDGKLTKEDLSLLSYLKDKNINNDRDLYEFLILNKDKKIDVFNSASEIKNFYVLNSFIYSMYVNVNNVTLIDGDVNGYILNMSSDDIKEVNIIKDNLKYTFTFYNINYFNDSFIKEFLNTIVID